MKLVGYCYEQGVTDGNLSGFAAQQIFHHKAHTVHLLKNQYHENMQEVVDLLRDEHGWSDSVSNLSNKLQRESLRYVEAVQLADALGYEIVWQKRR